MSSSRIDPRPGRFDGLPAPGSHPASSVLRDLGDGLILRVAGPADAVPLIEFNRQSLADPPDYGLENHAAAWTRDLVEGRHPRARVEDFILVEDMKRARIASSLCLLSHRILYGECELDIGQPELVGTHPAYRRRGLVRAMFDVLHERSDARGDDLQLIDGIPWFYRQFGYEYAIPKTGHLEVESAVVSALEAQAKVDLRPATLGDVPFMEAVYRPTSEGHNLGALRDRAQWEFELGARDPESLRRRDIYVVESDGRAAALLATFPILIHGNFYVTHCSRDSDVDWSVLAPSIVVQLARLANEIEQRDSAAFERLVLAFGCAHPFYDASGLGCEPKPPGTAFYVRCPDLAGLVRKLAPELERRLAASEHAGHTGSLELCFYRDGLRIEFGDGAIERVEDWAPLADEYGDASFPDKTFLQLLFGYRSLGQLREGFVDCQLVDEANAGLLEALFPPGTSNLWLSD